MADRPFVAALQAQAATLADQHARKKAGWMLRVVLNSRPDLREQDSQNPCPDIRHPTLDIQTSAIRHPPAR